jgi:hypothetical protein
MLALIIRHANQSPVACLSLPYFSTLSHERYADYILSGSLHTIKQSTEASGVVSKMIGLEVNAEETKYMIMSRNQNAERSHNIKIDNNFFEWAEQLK